MFLKFKTKKKLSIFYYKTFRGINIFKLLFNLDCKIVSDYCSFKSLHNKNFSFKSNKCSKSSNAFETITVKLLIDYMPRSLREIKFLM